MNLDDLKKSLGITDADIPKMLKEISKQEGPQKTELATIATRLGQLSFFDANYDFVKIVSSLTKLEEIKLDQIKDKIKKINKKEFTDTYKTIKQQVKIIRNKNIENFKSFSDELKFLCEEKKKYNITNLQKDQDLKKQFDTFYVICHKFKQNKEKIKGSDTLSHLVAKTTNLCFKLQEKIKELEQETKKLEQETKELEQETKKLEKKTKKLEKKTKKLEKDKKDKLIESLTIEIELKQQQIQKDKEQIEELNLDKPDCELLSQQLEILQKDLKSSEEGTKLIDELLAALK